jgi:hypothetical protein
MYYEWKVCNSKEIEAVEFPYMEKTIQLTNFYNQEYRIYMTERSITLYQAGKRNFVLFKENAGRMFKFGDNDFFRLERLYDGSYDVYHGQEA